MGFKRKVKLLSWKSCGRSVPQNTDVLHMCCKNPKAKRYLRNHYFLRGPHSLSPQRTMQEMGFVCACVLCLLNGGGKRESLLVSIWNPITPRIQEGKELIPLVETVACGLRWLSPEQQATSEKSAAPGSMLVGCWMPSYCEKLQLFRKDKCPPEVFV